MASQEGTASRRAHFRLPVQFRLLFRPEGKAAWREGTALNLSVGGLLLASERLGDLDEETCLEGDQRLELSLPDGPLRIRVRIVWFEGDDPRAVRRAGLAFEDLGCEETRRLEDHLGHLLRNR